MSLEDCFESRQLREIPPDLLKAGKSLETAEYKLVEARELSNAGFGSAAIVTAYASMLHSARALLYRDGFQEKSHYCVIQYLKEKYAKIGSLQSVLVTVMDAFRAERHDIMYGFAPSKVKSEDVEAAVENAGEMIKAVRKLIVV